MCQLHLPLSAESLHMHFIHYIVGLLRFMISIAYLFFYVSYLINAVSKGWASFEPPGDKDTLYSARSLATRHNNQTICCNENRQDFFPMQESIRRRCTDMNYIVMFACSFLIPLLLLENVHGTNAIQRKRFWKNNFFNHNNNCT